MANSSSSGLLNRANETAPAITSPIFGAMLPLASITRPMVTGVSSLLNKSIGTRAPLSKTANRSRERSETYVSCLMLTITGRTTSSDDELWKVGS